MPFFLLLLQISQSKLSQCPTYNSNCLNDSHIPQLRNMHLIKLAQLSDTLNFRYSIYKGLHHQTDRDSPVSYHYHFVCPYMVRNQLMPRAPVGPKNLCNVSEMTESWYKYFEGKSFSRIHKYHSNTYFDSKIHNISYPHIMS